MVTHNPSKETAEDAAKAKEKLERLLAAYAQVFGLTDKDRSEAQRLVWSDMERRGYIHRSTAVYLNGGEVQGIRMEIAEGMRIFVLDTANILSRASQVGKKPTRKIKTK